MADQVERRKAARHRVLKPGKIVFNNHQSTIDCIVRSQSPEGARLKLPTVIGVPDEFDLVIMNDAPRACHVVWRSATEIGVAYAEAG